MKPRTLQEAINTGMIDGNSEAFIVAVLRTSDVEFSYAGTRRQRLLILDKLVQNMEHLAESD